MSNIGSLLSTLKQQHYPYYLWVMLAPPAARARLCAFLAFELELAAIPGKVSEEMLGLIRFQWWEESVEMLEAGALSREHPVLRGLESVLSSCSIAKQAEQDLSPQRDSARSLQDQQNDVIKTLKSRINLHRTHYTEHEGDQPCGNIHQSLVEACVELILSSCSTTKQAEQDLSVVRDSARLAVANQQNDKIVNKWQRKVALIDAHLAKHKSPKSPWLMMRLLFA